MSQEQTINEMMMNNEMNVVAPIVEEKKKKVYKKKATAVVDAPIVEETIVVEKKKRVNKKKAFIVEEADDKEIEMMSAEDKDAKDVDWEGKVYESDSDERVVAPIVKFSEETKKNDGGVKVKKVRKAKVVKIRDENTPETQSEKLKREAKEMIAKAKELEKEEKQKENITEIKEKLLLKRTLKRDALELKISEMRDERLLLCVEIRKIDEEMTEDEMIALYNSEKKSGGASANREVREFETLTGGHRKLKYAPSDVLCKVEEGKTLASVEYHSRPRVKCSHFECEITTRRVCNICESVQTCKEHSVCPSCDKSEEGNGSDDE